MLPFAHVGRLLTSDDAQTSASGHVIGLANPGEAAEAGCSCRVHMLEVSGQA